MKIGFEIFENNVHVHVYRHRSGTDNRLVSIFIRIKLLSHYYFEAVLPIC